MLKFYLTPPFLVRIYTHKHIHDTREEVSTKKSPNLGIEFIFSKKIRKYIYVYIYMSRSSAPSIPYPSPPCSPTQPTTTGLNRFLLLQNPPTMCYARVQHFVRDVNIIILHLEVHNTLRRDRLDLCQSGCRHALDFFV